MFNLKKQQDKLNQISRERKYRPSFFGLSVHFDWRMILFFVVLILILIVFWGIKMQIKISEVYQKDYSDEVQIENIEKIEIEKFNKILEKLEN